MPVPSVGLPRCWDWFDLTLRQTFGRSLLRTRPIWSGWHRAFRKPTLDSSRVYVRFSFQGPRQLWLQTLFGAASVLRWGREYYSQRPIRQLLFLPPHHFFTTPRSQKSLGVAPPQRPCSLSRTRLRRTRTKSDGRGPTLGCCLALRQFSFAEVGVVSPSGRFVKHLCEE